MHKIIKFGRIRAIRVGCALVISLRGQQRKNMIFGQSSILINPSWLWRESLSFWLKIVQIINKSSYLVNELCYSLEIGVISWR